METFSALLASCARNSQITCEFPAQRPVQRSFDVSLICAWTNNWANNRDAVSDMFSLSLDTLALSSDTLSLSVQWVVSLPFREISKIISRNRIYHENFKLKLGTCAQSHALDTRTKFQFEILIRNTTSIIHKFQVNILERSRKVCESHPRLVTS